MRYLGIDYGEKRIGIAISAEKGSFAFPYGVVMHDKDALEKICGIIEKEQISEIALGLPQNFDRKDTNSTEKVRKFGEELEKRVKIKITFVDETLSTAEVIKSGASSREMRDASAAALILGTFLDRKKKNGMIE